MSLITSAIVVSVQMHVSQDPVFTDNIRSNVIQFAKYCDLEETPNLWKYNVMSLVMMTVMMVGPSITILVLNVLIIKAMNWRAEEWGQEDPHKWVNIYFVYYFENVMLTVNKLLWGIE